MRQSNKMLEKKFRLGLELNTGFMVFELIVGLVVNSLALIADAIHNLTDSMTLLISWLANKVARKPADAGHTFGHGRAVILAALVNCLILVGAAVFIFIEAYHRLITPEHVKSGGVVAIVAGVGIIINGVIAWLFANNRNDLNAKSAYVNMLFDTIFSVAAVVAGVMITVTGKLWIDPLISMMICFGLLYATVTIVVDASNILLEGVPRDIDLANLRSEITALEEVKEIKDLKVWAINTNEYALSCHFIPEHHIFKDLTETTAKIKEQLKAHGIREITIEID